MDLRFIERPMHLLAKFIHQTLPKHVHFHLKTDNTTKQRELRSLYFMAHTTTSTIQSQCYQQQLNLHYHLQKRVLSEGPINTLKGSKLLAMYKYSP